MKKRGDRRGQTVFQYQENGWKTLRKLNQLRGSLSLDLKDVFVTFPALRDKNFYETNANHTVIEASESASGAQKNQ